MADIELFETWDEDGTSTGLVPRDEVHRTGLLHRSCYVMLTTSDGELIVQQRSTQKDLYPDCWDYTVGEHLLPGEAFIDGARRGLLEELGITQQINLQALAPPFRTRWISPDGQVIDFEEQQGFHGVYDGPVTIDGLEVQAWARWSLATLTARVARTDDGNVFLTPSFEHAIVTDLPTIISRLRA
ncbi:MAG: NUDIX domain-containing protein [Pseudomonadaceae bacterium]|nr:NUDIX domain-containing protein [Pseudomonadaceae bacterium]